MTTSEHQQRVFEQRKAHNRSVFLYIFSGGALVLGLAYASVPLYRAFCSATGFAGTPITREAAGEGRFAPDRLRVAQDAQGKDRWITVRFNADHSDALNWKFWPCQRTVRVRPGETTLAFYKAINRSDEDVIGIATYNVTPGLAAQYFAKVECFCFDEQRILAGEEVDLPIFFFLDRDIIDDPALVNVDDIILSYTFFKARRNTTTGQLEPDAPA